MKAPLKGSELRDQVARTLRLRYAHVEVEKRLATTTADVYYEENGSVFTQRIAIECKDWQRPLTSENLATIDNLYRPSLSNNEIDYLWIIRRHVLSSSPKQTVDRLAKVRYSTVEQFRSSLMNFDSLLESNIVTFKHDSASKNFVQARVKGADQTLISAVRHWIGGIHTGLIVYGGYGIGKTTFSFYLASVFSEEYRRGENYRVPVRIALSGIFTKQDLPSLICSNLLGGEVASIVPGFNFKLFMEANKEGQFLLILDGFDEMRHAMDLDDFIYTFDALKPLFIGRAKVIILGRPDSFLSNRDEDRVLSALYENRNERDEGLQKVEVSYFSKIEIEAYLDNFLSKRGAALSGQESDRYQSLLTSLPDDEDNILSRPIQLKMFTSLIDDYLEGGEDLTRYSIYEKFVYRFVKRELEKDARRYSSDVDHDREVRIRFMQSVAWWLICDKKDNKFVPSEIPTELIPKFSKRAAEPESAIREAIVGSVIEPVSAAGLIDRKANRFYYFPHKSYAEFLVAQHFSAMRFSKQLFVEFLRVVNPEILSFIEEDPLSGIENVRDGLAHMLGSVEYTLIDACAKKLDISNEFDKLTSFGSPSDLYIHYAFLRRNGQPVSGYMTRRLARARSIAVFATISNMSAILAGDGVEEDLIRSVLTNSISSLNAPAIEATFKLNASLKFYHGDLDGCRAAMLLLCTRLAPKTQSIVVVVDLLLNFAYAASRGALFASLPRQDTKRKTKITVRLSSIENTLSPAHLSMLKVLLGGIEQDLSWPIQLHGEAQNRFNWD